MTGRRSLTAALAAALLAPAGCSTGPGQVDVADGGEFRSVAGTPAGEVVPPGERGTAPEFSGTLLDGEAVGSAELAGEVAVLDVWGRGAPPAGWRPRGSARCPPTTPTTACGSWAST